MKPARFPSMLASAFVLSALFTPSCLSEEKSEPKLVMKKNRLANEASPYLRQHATNPVDWYPWGEEAFAKAKRENKPIFLSIGYSTCHWCHVMARESFQSEEIAKILNESFVSIKLDREERPDVDKVYMTSYQAMTGENGGWPLNVFLTPELDPFYGGTYFPPTSRGGRVGFDSALLQLKEAWEKKQDKVVESAAALRLHLKENNGAGMGSTEVPEQLILDRAATMLLESGDQVEGGWGNGPKFPMPSHLGFLICAWKTNQNPQMLAFAELTAEKMMHGGIMDQLGGGFHRYAVDGKWLVPHFEKMLYDQAQILDVYLDLYQITKNEKYAKVAREISDYVIKDLTAPNGAFYCAEDAQSEGKEGKYFAWTTAELETLLSKEQFDEVCAYYGITEAGNFYDHSDPEALKGQNVLSVVKSDSWFAEKPERLKILAQAISKMKKARAGRIRPGIDDKVLSSWNGMMIGALERAGVVLGEKSYSAAAGKAHDFIRKNMWNGEKLAHRWHADSIDFSPQAESYLLLLQATRRRYELTLDPMQLDFAISLAEASVKLFFDEKNGGFFESAEADDVMVRLKGDYDGAMPTASSIASLEFLKLAEITGRKDFEQVALRTLKAHGEVIKLKPTSMTCMLEALDFYYAKRQRLVLAEGDNGLAEFYTELGGSYLPHLTVMGNKGKVDEFERGLKAQGGKTTGYLCEGESCQTPQTDAKLLLNK